MAFNWSSQDYREIISDYLGHREQRRPRGSVKAFAEKLRCHSTFVAQVFGGKANFSLEQGSDICEYFSFDEEQSDYFLHLLMLERAGTESLKRYIQKKIDRIRERQVDLEVKLKSNEHTSFLDDFEYFSSWFYQAAHALSQLPGGQTISALSRALGPSIEDVEEIMTHLQSLNLVKKTRNLWISTEDFVHLPKTSRAIRQLHLTWKGKVLADLQSGRSLVGTHYSGIITVTEKDYQKVRSTLVEALAKIKKITEGSTSENGYVLSMDCYPLLSEPL